MKINIRESLLQIDRDTDCKYDLTSLYESCRLEEREKKELVKMIANYDSPEALGSYMSKVSGCGLAESIGDDDLSDEEVEALQDSVELEEGLWDDIKKVGKAVGSSLKNDTPIGRAVSTVARGIKNDVKRVADKSGIKNVAKAAKDAFKDTDTYKNYKGDEGAAKVAQSIKQHKKDMKSPDNIAKYILRLKKEYPMFDYTSSSSRIAKEVQKLCKEKGWDFNEVIKKAGLKLKESLNESIDRNALESEIKAKVNSIIDEVDMPVVEFSTEDGFIKIDVRAELGYDALMDVATQLDPIVAKYDDRAYFEPVTAGILVAYVDENGYVNELDQDAADMWIDKFSNCKNMNEIRIVHSSFSDADLSMATVDAVWDKLHDIIDNIRENEKDEYLFDNLDTKLEELFEKALSESVVPLNEDNELIPIEIVPDNRKIQYYIGDKEVPYTSWEEAKEHFKDDFKILDYKKELQDYINAHDGHFTVEETTDDRLCIDISWGDWKHDHAFADYLVKEFFSDKGLYPSIEVEMVEEDGSDAYSAIHYYDLDDFGLSGIYVNESLKESKSLYLFPELNDEDLEAAKTYGLNYLGRNKGAKGDEDNYVVSGDKSSLQRYADKYLGYELHPDYLYDDEDDFAGEIIKEEVELTNCPNCGGERFNDNTGLCVDCGYDEKGHGELDESKSMNEDADYNPEYSNYIEEVAQRIDAGEYDDHYEVCEYVSKKFNKDIDIVKNDINKLISKESNSLKEYYDLVDRKSVEDSDGFMTDYSMYHDVANDKYVFVFGDSDIYYPEDGDFDWECETEEEAREWFDSYNGFADEEDNKLIEADEEPRKGYDSRAVIRQVWRMIANSEKLTDDDSRYWDIDRGVHEGDEAVIIHNVEEAPKTAMYQFSLMDAGIDLDVMLDRMSDNDTWYIIDNSGAKYGDNDYSFDESLQERNLTRAERHNRNMDKIFDYKKSTDNKMMQFLRDNSDLSEEEIKKAYDDDELSLKIKELGLHDAFWAKNESLNEADEEEPYSKEMVEQDLKSITHNFTDKEGDLKCGFEVEKDYGVEILKNHYEVVEVSGDDRRDGKWYHISFSNPKDK